VVPAADNPSAEWAAHARLIAQRLKRDYGAERVILFGSVARGTAHRYSDVDPLVIARVGGSRRERLDRLYHITHDLTQRLDISPLVLTPEELDVRLHRGDPFIQNIIRAGVEL